MAKCLKHVEDAVVTYLDAAKVLQPSVGALDFPAPLVASQLALVFEVSLAYVATIGHDQLRSTLLESLPQRVRIVTAVGDDAPQMRPWPATASPRDFHLADRAFRKPTLGNLRGRKLDSKRYAAAVDHHHALRAFPATRLSNPGAPFFAIMNVASRKASSQSRKRLWSSIDRSLRQAASQTPSSSHLPSLRQQVDPSGYSGGRSRHRAPVRNTHNMPSRHERFGAQGRPRPSLRRWGSGNNGSRTRHCASLNRSGSFFCLMAKDQQPTRHTRKYLR